MKIEVAERIFEVHNKHDFLTRLCAPYLSDKEAEASISATEQDIAREKSLSEEVDMNDAEYALESLAVHRKICEYLALKNGFLMHAATIEVDGKAIAFLAKSGVGKSTHISNWRKAFGDKVKLVNGDKPIIYEKEGIYYACGTPWSGKENWQRRVSVPLYALCFLSRGEVDECREISAEQIGFRLFDQVYVPQIEECATAVMDNMEKMLKQVKLFELKCTKEQQSAVVAYNAIIGE